MKICMGCMNQIADNERICSNCGFEQSNIREKSYYLDPGTILGGKYIIGKALEYNGYTVKYLGYDAEMQRKVIIREYLPSDFSTRSDGESDATIYSGDAYEQFSKGLQTFLNEGSLIQSLGNVDGIASIYDCVAANDTGYIVSEYLVGTTLKEVLDTGRIYKAEEAKSFIQHILLGLTKVHSLNVIHCDIAPDTIFITEKGEVKLLDFGSAKYVTTANSKSLAIILKQGFAPEEQYRSHGKRGPWTDVYALAAVMYRMITGKNPPESVDRALSDELVEPSKQNIDISTSTENALMNALNVYQGERTASAEAFYRELSSGETKRRKVKQAKRDTGKVPVWIKGLVAVGAIAIVAGGAFVVKGLQNKGGNNQGATQKKFNIVSEVKNNELKLEDFDKEWTDFGFKEKNRTIEYRYEPNVAENTVLEYEDRTNDVLKDGRIYSEVEEEIKNSDSVYANIIVASTKNISFSDKWLKNCTAGRWAGNKNVSRRLKSAKAVYRQSYIPDGVTLKKGDASEAYGTLSKIVYSGGTIDIDSIRSKTSDSEQADKEIKKETDKLNGMNISDSNIQFVYHTGAYYTMSEKACRSYSSFTGKNISDIRFVYSRNIKDHKSGNKSKMRALSSEKYSSDYISFRYKNGTIVNVLSKGLKNGSGYDGRDDDSENGDGKLFSTVRRYVPLNRSLTVGKLKRYAVNAGASLKTQYSDDYIVKSVAINGKNNVTEFKSGDRLTITAEPKPTPRPTPEPTKRAAVRRDNSNSTEGTTPKKSVPQNKPKKSKTNSSMDEDLNTSNP